MFTQSHRPLGVIILLLSTVLITSMVTAEQKKTFKQYDIHYVATSTAMLTPAIAKAYDIQRSKSKGLVTIAIRNTETESASEGLVRGSVKNAISQMQALSFTKVNDQDAIYYLAVFNYADQENLDFDILVSPMGVQDTFVVQFKQQFFID